MDRDATSAEVVVEEREPSTARLHSRRPRFETAALGAPASDEGTALGEPWQCSADCSSCCSLEASVAIALVAPRPANGARGGRGGGVVPRFSASGSQVTGRASGGAAQDTPAEQRPLVRAATIGSGLTQLGAGSPNWERALSTCVS